MDETRKRTDRKSRSTKGSSRVVDMSWAAKYLDDDWENKYSAEGACDTRVARPVGERKGEEEENSREEQIRMPDLSDTQRFMAVNSQMISEDARISDAVTNETLGSVEVGAAETVGSDAPVRIRDAITDQTVANVEDAKAVRTVLFQMGFDEDLDELAGLRDARSNRLGEEAAAVAAAKADMAKTLTAKPAAKKKTVVKTEPTDKDDLFSKTIVAKKPATTGSTAQTKKAEDVSKTAIVKKTETADKVAAEKKTPETAVKAEEKKSPGSATIVASKETRNVRKAASESIEVEEFLTIDKSSDADKKSSEGKADRKRSAERRRPVEQRRTRQRPAYREDYDNDREYDADRRAPYDYEDRDAYMPSKSPLRFIPLVLVVALCVFGFIAAREICHDVPLNASDYSKVKYTVTEDLTDAQLAQDLESLGIINNQLIFRIRCRFYSADYVEGTYELSPCYSTEKIINILSGYVYGTDD